MTDYHKKEIEIKKEEFNDLVTELHSPLTSTGKAFKLWIAFLLLLLGLAGFMYVRQLKYGLSTTDMRDIASWGLYIADFVFLIAVSLQTIPKRPLPLLPPPKILLLCPKDFLEKIILFFLKLGFALLLA